MDTNLKLWLSERAQFYCIYIIYICACVCIYILNYIWYAIRAAVNITCTTHKYPYIIYDDYTEMKCMQVCQYIIYILATLSLSIMISSCNSRDHVIRCVKDTVSNWCSITCMSHTGCGGGWEWLWTSFSPSPHSPSEEPSTYSTNASLSLSFSHSLSLESPLYLMNNKLILSSSRL